MQSKMASAVRRALTRRFLDATDDLAAMAAPADGLLVIKGD